MKILAIDQSLNFSGIAISLDGKFECVSTIEAKCKGVERLADIVGKIGEIIDKYNIDFVTLEDYSFGSKGRATFSLGEMCGCIKYYLFSRDIEFLIIPINTWKKFLCGGNVGKDMILLAAYKKWNKEFKNNNECDAFCMLKFIEAFYTWKIGVGDFNNREIETFKKFDKSGDIIVEEIE